MYCTNAIINDPILEPLVQLIIYLMYNMPKLTDRINKVGPTDERLKSVYSILQEASFPLGGVQHRP